MWLRNEPKWYNLDLVLGILDPDLRSAFTSHNHENGANEILCLDSASEVVNLIARSETRYYYKFTVSIGETQQAKRSQSSTPPVALLVPGCSRAAGDPSGTAPTPGAHWFLTGLAHPTESRTPCSPASVIVQAYSAIGSDPCYK
jgi:hypothetical protein